MASEPLDASDPVDSASPLAPRPLGEEIPEEQAGAARQYLPDAFSPVERRGPGPPHEVAFEEEAIISAITEVMVLMNGPVKTHNQARADARQARRSRAGG